MAQGIKHVHCVACGRHVDVCGGLSTRYRCMQCAVDLCIQNARELRAKRGDAYERWKASMRRVAARL